MASEATAEASAYLARDETIYFSLLDSPMFGPDVKEQEVSVKLRRNVISPFVPLENWKGNEDILCVMLDNLLFSPALTPQIAEGPEGEAYNGVNERELKVVITLSKTTVPPAISIVIKGNAVQDFLFGLDNVKLWVTLSQLNLVTCKERQDNEWKPCNVSIEALPEKTPNGSVIFTSAEPTVMGIGLEEFMLLMETLKTKPAPHFTAECRVVLTTTQDKCEDPLAVNKKLLLEHYKSDMKLVAQNGTVLPCHKFFLRTYSQVLTDLIDKNMDDDNQLLLRDTTEDTARAMLAYLYFRDEDKPLENLSIALELLVAANTYSIPVLEEAMKCILSMKSNESFPVAMAFRLFFPANRNPDWRNLKVKAVGIMKSKAEELFALEEYRNLFDQNPADARELCSALVVATDMELNSKKRKRDD